ncbi:MAG: hypothetical protein LC798_05820 [Chloroflexi bacterium]|nr:hypothetical protein [Chloroflexota bacterium]
MAPGRILTAALLGVAAIFILLLIDGRAKKFGGRLALIVGPAAPWMPIIAAATTIAALFLEPAEPSAAGRELAVVMGIAAAAVIGLIGSWSVTFRSRAEKVNARMYADILEKHRAVSVRLTCAEKSSRAGCGAVDEAREHVHWVGKELGVAAPEREERGREWWSGYGYASAWMALHRAEEALLLVADSAELVGVVLHDRLRTSNSPLAHLRQRVTDSQADLDRIATAVSPSHRTGFMRRLAVDTASDRAARVRTEVAAVRRAINEFRDSRWDGLARARNRLNYTTALTAWTGYLLLILSLGLQASREAAAAAAVFFLIGALIGLFAQLRLDAQREEVVEDFGMAAARLRQTVVASGIAAVAGVLIVTIAAGATGTSEGAGTDTLGGVFNLDANPAQLLIAAVFGLSPALLIERLTASADQYRADLKETETGEGGAASYAGDAHRAARS